MIPNWMGIGFGLLRKDGRTPAGAEVGAGVTEEEETEGGAEARAWIEGALKPEGRGLQHPMRRAGAEADQMTDQGRMTETGIWTEKVKRKGKDQELQMKEAEAGQMTEQGTPTEEAKRKDPDRCPEPQMRRVEAEAGQMTAQGTRKIKDMTQEVPEAEMRGIKTNIMI